MKKRGKKEGGKRKNEKKGSERKIEGKHCKRRLSGFPSPAGMSFTKLSLAGNKVPSPNPGRFGQNKSKKLVNFFYSESVGKYWDG